MTTLRETLAEHEHDGCGDCICSEYVLNEPYAAHLETVVLAWVGERLAGAGVLEDVCEAIADVSGRADVGETEAAIEAIRDALGVPVAPAGGEVAPGGATGDEIGREIGAEGLWERNRRAIDHEIATPMRGHDEDGACCRWAAVEHEHVWVRKLHESRARCALCKAVDICDPGCPLLGCPTCPAEAANRAMLEAK